MVLGHLFALANHNRISGNIIGEGSSVTDIRQGGLLQWRIKQSKTGTPIIVSLYFKPTAYSSSHGDMTSHLGCFIDIDLEAAKQSYGSLEYLLEAYGGERPTQSNSDPTSITLKPSKTATLNWLDRRLVRFASYNYRTGEVLFRGREVRGILNRGSLQWRIKRTKDESHDFVSLFARPLFYYGQRAPSRLNCYLDIDLNAAYQSLADLNAVIKILETNSIRGP